MRRMKTTIVLVLMLAYAAGCSKETKAKTTPVPPGGGTAKQDTRPAPDIKADQPVSPSLAVSPDIATACGIKAPATPTPTFDYDKDELTSEDRTVLDTLATCLATGALKGKTVALIGRADPRGTDEYNLGLGSRRAYTVGRYLGRLGVTPAQLAVTTRGAIDATGTDEAGWKQDRRVDIQLATE
jgi:peptidoglycan-associated lipoprotein